eukprot:403343401
MYQPPAKEASNVGQIISPQRRHEIARAFKSSHFSLSGGEGAVYKSTTQSQFVPYTQQTGGITSKQTDIQMRKSNFALGEPSPKQLQTTNQANYQGPPNHFKAVTIDAATKADLRKSHWGIGGQGFGNIYVSTQGASYSKRSPSVQAVADLKDTNQKIQLMRGHHFNFGNEHMTYETTTKSKFNLDGAGSRFKQPVQAGPEPVNNAKNDLRKHHFDLGGQSGSMMTTHQIEFSQKSPAQNRNTSLGKIDKSKTSITIGDGQSYPMTTSAQLQFKAHNATPQGLDKELLKNLRSAHFQLGQHPAQYESANQGYGGFKQPNSPTQLDQNIQKKLRNSSLEIGDKSMGGAFYQTTYKINNAPKNLQDAKPLPTNNNRSFQSNFQIGGENNKFMDMTSTGAAYQQYGNIKAAQPDKSFEANLRAKHFALSHTEQSDPLHYKTSHQNQFQSPPAGGTFRGVLNQEKKNELRKNHFDFGVPGQGMIAQSATHSFFNTPKMSVAQQQAPNMHNSALALKHNSLKLNNAITAPGGGDFVSNSQMAFKWVQPQFVNH